MINTKLSKRRLKFIIRNFWLTNIELQKLKSEVTEDEYKYTINEAEKKHFFVLADNYCSFYNGTGCINVLLLLLPRINIGDTE